MSATMIRPPSSPSPEASERELRRRLAALRRRLRLVAFCRGGGWLLAAVLLPLAVVGVVDYRLHLPGLARAVVLVSLLAAGGVIVLRFLLRPLRQPADDLSLALRIEDRYPLLNDSLASTVQFLAGGVGGDSVSMRREAVRRALGRAAGLDFSRVADARGTRSALVAAVVTLALAGSLAARWPALAATAAARLANPFASVDWPKKTRLELEGVPARIGRGREYRVHGSVAGVVPREVVVEFAHEGFPVQRKTFAIAADGAFVIHLKPDEVQRSFRFRVMANDAVSPEFPVEVLALPRLVHLNGRPSPRLRLDLPTYTGLLSPQEIPSGTGNLDVLAGTVVTLRAAADRPLSRAWVSYQPEAPGTLQAAALAPVGIGDPLSAAASLLVSNCLYERVPARLEADGAVFEVVFRPGVHGMYAIGFVDENGLENAQTFELRLRLDAPPVVRLERPSASKDALTVLPTAELPLHAVADDGAFAVRSVWLEYRTKAEDEPRRQTLFDADVGLGREIAWWGSVAAVAAPSPRVRLPRLEFQRTIRLSQIRHLDVLSLRAGDSLTLQIKADDFDDVSVGKPAGESHQVTIKVIGRDAFDAEVNREQARIQQELAATRDRQREALEKVRAAEARVRRGEKLTPDREAEKADVEARQARQEADALHEKAEKSTDQEDRKAAETAAAAQREKAKKAEDRAYRARKQSAQVAEAEQQQQQVRERIGAESQGLRAEIEKLAPYTPAKRYGELRCRGANEERRSGIGPSG